MLYIFSKLIVSPEKLFLFQLEMLAHSRVDSVLRVKGYLKYTKEIQRSGLGGKATCLDDRQAQADSPSTTNELGDSEQAVTSLSLSLLISKWELIVSTSNDCLEA